MMLLKDLLAPWFHYARAESFYGLTLDSRQIDAGKVFVALPGYKVDGRKYINAAIENGAIAVLAHTDDSAQHEQVELINSVPVIYFCQLTRQISAVAAQYYTVSNKLKVIGITGTNGKTSVSQIIAQLVTLLGKKAAVMGTLGNGLWGDLADSGNTTADAITVMQQLADFERQGANVCAMEVSSHGLVQGRIEAVPFNTAIFTNLSRDHLDYHGDMDAYSAAKKRLFQFASLSNGLINLDDPVGQQWLSELQQKALTPTDLFNRNASKLQLHSFSLTNIKADFYCQDTVFDDQGVSATLVYPSTNGDDKRNATLISPLLGHFNLSNVLAAISALSLQGIEIGEILNVLPHIKPVAGRMERFAGQNKATLVVDYAHTPDAIEQALKALRVHCAGQLWCVFGCGGDRDKGKRPLMAKAAEQFADRVMVTSDNTRSENPQDIIDDVFAGLTAPQNALSEVDRISAIKWVVAQAKPNDIILLAGKGHETYQEVAGKRVDYDERALAAMLMETSV
ncbi:UDP-N-acetylmuramoyl-L-alanyl-D-glutamate--2,6-diaminopimelate ligase [Shewanella sp. OMA3-2]|uniref:UDP-N-acetylmuramoyl-L-alanyl-D-glutamate--2, 6-diaminopimelate ligase n=1 Tax=Shewanella sp. OMA3-2 TaxID=2908650 RepID=UPI001F15B706|nr:UDP-N-acetylmuramoyl-L-alanyl-D-glutamate--2,6-diaminopimelate ligase [Shewanella sp. OMA3-2]UJF22464.1 UDP-N-acetylmuramoyl-L-alanyl-D-glutamate--2,6-diaminopimelate ligase [Shewanella sp. OMA3-2]